MARYASGKYAYGLSDRSGFRYRLREMRKEWNGLVVGPDEFEPKHPQLEAPRVGPDPQALRNPRPDRSESLTVFVYTDQIGLPEEGPRAVGRVGTVTIGGTVPSVDVDVPVTGASTTPAVGDVTVSVPTVALTFDSTDNTLDSTDNTFDEGVETESLTLDSTDSTFDSADNTFDEA